MGKSFRFETGAVSHTGLARDHNEDRFLSEPASGLWLVADGMGGHLGGEYASGSIVDHLASIGKPSSAPDLQARFVERIGRANDEIQNHALSSGGTIGSTVVALLTFEQHFACVWSGDSRIYMVRDGQLTQLSRDHTEANELLDRGAITAEEAESWPRKNVITRAVGVGEEVDLDHKYGTLRNRDTFVLCSDGLTAHVDDPEIREIANGNQPQKACEMLLDMTLDRGATDNTTVMIVRAFDKTEVAAFSEFFDIQQQGA
ncbi:PP2C family serine/threonine-protein phosphatase [Actibacterium sp. 188UL27-1]|uniref:PP2C family protein-serine/threonine phosphatase n=1 Tax=Actibacterium sp. 188UL27-1 TaxID=2786961 RepID=UPI00195E3A52|nr:protein phosphatase 2C domain-containing protein [Actibacterium sp. 188UL27-1]MBM7068840.1 serine/threonine-protein phosphatase [Actibacterium sp. 188UL27-1]